MDKLTPEQIAAKAAQKAEASMVKRKAEIVKNYPHALVDTLTFDEAAGNGGKFKVQIRCVECGNEDRWVYTSDLFQVKTCTACSEAAAKAKKDAKKAELKFPEVIKGGKFDAIFGNPPYGAAAAALLKEKSTVQA